MSQRETQVQSSLQKWKGVNQRTQPTLLEDGFFSMSQGIYFGLGDNAERIPGKQLAGYLQGLSIFNIFQFGNISFIQTKTKLFSVPTSDLINFSVPHYIPPILEEEDMSQALFEYQAATGGTVAATAGSWGTVPVNTEVSDPDGIASLASNKITLGAGNYRWKSTVNFYQTDRSKTRIYDVTNSVELKRGMNCVATASTATAQSTIFYRFSLSGPTDLRLEYLVTSSNSEGLLAYAPFPSGSGGIETGAQIEILKE